MEAQFCMHCGKPIPAGSGQRFCLSCGRTLSGGALIPAARPASPEESGTPVGAWKVMFKKCGRMFHGRSRRQEYWMAVAMNGILYGIAFAVFLTCAIMAAVSQTPALLWMGIAVLYVMSLFLLAAAIPMWALSVRRLHDTGRSGWYLLLSLIPLVGAIILLVFLCTDSQMGPNQYGPDPKERQS